MLVTLEGNNVLSARKAVINIKINLLLKKDVHNIRERESEAKTFSFAHEIFSYH